MAKCGCAGSGCSCLVQAGAGIGVRGTGTTTNPYIVSAELVNLVVTDTDTINLTATGDGTPTDPLVLSAEYIGEPPDADWTPAESRSWSGAVSLADVLSPLTIRVAMAGNVTSVTMPVWLSSSSGRITLVLTQDATGGRTWVTPGTTAGGADITLSTAPGAKDVVEAFWTGTQWVLTAKAMAVS